MAGDSAIAEWKDSPAVADRAADDVGDGGARTVDPGDAYGEEDGARAARDAYGDALFTLRGDSSTAGECAVKPKRLPCGDDCTLAVARPTLSDSAGAYDLLTGRRGSIPPQYRSCHPALNPRQSSTSPPQCTAVQCSPAKPSPAPQHGTPAQQRLR